MSRRRRYIAPRGFGRRRRVTRAAVRRGLERLLRELLAEGLVVGGPRR